MSTNPPSEERLVARDPENGPLVHKVPMLALAVCVGLFFSALVGTAFMRYALTRRRQKKEAREQEKQDHWQAKGKAREEAPIAYVQPMYPVRRWGSLGPSEGGTTFGTVTSSLQTASDAAVHGSPSPSPLPSPPSAAIVRRAMLPKEQEYEEKVTARVSKNALPSVWNGTATEPPSSESNVLGQPATAFESDDLQASQAPRGEQNVEGGHMTEEYRSLQEGWDNIPFAELCTDHNSPPISATLRPPSSTQHPDYSTGAYAETTLSRHYPLPTTPPPLYHPPSPLETPQGQRPCRPRTRRIARDGGVRLEGGDGIPSIYSTRTRTRSVVTIASGTTDNSTPESTNTLPPPYGGSNAPEGSEPNQ